MPLSISGGAALAVFDGPSRYGANRPFQVKLRIQNVGPKTAELHLPQKGAGTTSYVLARMELLPELSHTDIPIGRQALKQFTWLGAPHLEEIRVSVPHEKSGLFHNGHLQEIFIPISHAKLKHLMEPGAERFQYPYQMFGPFYARVFYFHEGQSFTTEVPLTWLRPENETSLGLFPRSDFNANFFALRELLSEDKLFYLLDQFERAEDEIRKRGVGFESDFSAQLVNEAIPKVRAATTTEDFLVAIELLQAKNNGDERYWFGRDRGHARNMVLCDSWSHLWNLEFTLKDYSRLLKGGIHPSLAALIQPKVYEIFRKDDLPALLKTRYYRSLLKSLARSGASITPFLPPPDSGTPYSFSNVLKMTEYFESIDDASRFVEVWMPYLRRLDLSFLQWQAFLFLKLDGPASLTVGEAALEKAGTAYEGLRTLRRLLHPRLYPTTDWDRQREQPSRLLTLTDYRNFVRDHLFKLSELDFSPKQLNKLVWDLKYPVALSQEALQQEGFEPPTNDFNVSEWSGDTSATAEAEITPEAPEANPSVFETRDQEEILESLLHQLRSKRELEAVKLPAKERVSGNFKRFLDDVPTNFPHLTRDCLAWRALKGFSRFTHHFLPHHDF